MLIAPLFTALSAQRIERKRFHLVLKIYILLLLLQLLFDPFHKAGGAQFVGISFRNSVSGTCNRPVSETSVTEGTLSKSVPVGVLSALTFQ